MKKNRNKNKFNFTKNGCVDCGRNFSIPSGDWRTGSVVFKQSLQIADIYRDITINHFIIVGKTEPERMFLSCKTFEFLHSDEGVKAILDFIALPGDKIESKEEEEDLLLA